MSIPATVRHTGVLSVGSPSAGFAARLSDTFDTGFCATFGNSKNGRPSIVGATDVSPFVIPLEGITKVRALAVRVRGGAGKIKLSSAAGADQVIPLSGESQIIWFNPVPADEVTAVKFVGTADIEYSIAGDL